MARIYAARPPELKQCPLPVMHLAVASESPPQQLINKKLKMCVCYSCALRKAGYTSSRGKWNFSGNRKKGEKKQKEGIKNKSVASVPSFITCLPLQLFSI